MPAPAAPQVVPPGPPRLRLEDKVLSLEFLLLDAQFNEPGRYKLQLRVENPLLDDSMEGVTVRVNNGDMIPSCEAETDTAEQGDLTDTLTFDKNNFLFILPKGLCKNDKHHDVRLCIDVLKFGSGILEAGKKVGQALFAIYPRPNQPRINLRAAPFEPLYNYQGVLALLRVAGDHMAMHCGRLAYNVCFREYNPPETEDISKPSSPIPSSLKVGNSQLTTSTLDIYKQSTYTAPISYSSHSEAITSDPQTLNIPTPRTHHHASENQGLSNLKSLDDEDDDEDEEVEKVERMSSLGLDSLQDQDNLEYEADKTLPHLILPHVSQSLPHDAPLHLPSPPKTPATARKTHVKEKAPSQCNPVQGADNRSALLPLPGTEKIVVTLHSATSIPSNAAGSLPTPFICLMSSVDEKKGSGAQSISHAAQAPTTSPIWGETLTLTVNEEEAKEEDLIVTVADNPSQDLLLEYRLPIGVLEPFHPYQLCLVQPHVQAPDGCHLYVTIERRTSSIAQLNGFTYSALQVLLVGVEISLQDPSYPLLALARIVPNYKDDRQTSKPPGMPGVSHVKVTFPKPSSSCFQISQRATQGHPQISFPGLPPSQPIWNSSYLFQGRDGVTLFSDGAALVLEYHPVTADSRRVPWHLSNHCGFSVVPLDMEVYHKLLLSTSNKALTITGVPIQGTELKTISGEAPRVSLQLLLLKTERPEFFLSASEIQTSTHCQTQTHTASGHTREEAGTPNKDKLQKDAPSLPSYNALAEILPDPWVLQTAREQKLADPADLPKQPNKNFPPQYLSNSMDVPADHVMEHQEQELANYRLAMQRMADDIIALRRQMSGLEAENSTLRSERSLNQDAGRNLLSDADIDVMTKAELADRLVTLKQKLASETAELRSMRDRTQQLQNELVRRNDREKELLLLQRAHQQQQAVVTQYHQRLSRAKAIQDTVRKQEKVIEKMEKLLDNKLRDEKKGRVDKGDRGAQSDALQREVYATLLAENSRLREELDRTRLTTTVLPQVPIHETFTDTEKFSLLSKLEKSQARVQSLERELEEAARRWGREKQQLLTQLSEHQMGFSRTHTTILHHFPMKEPELNTRRPTKLNALI